MKNLSPKQQLLSTIRNQLLSVAESESERNLIAPVIEAMDVIDRRFFVDELHHAYLNKALPIGQRQTISQPFTVARMLQLAAIKSGNDVLEVGSGSGWNACIMAYLAFPGYALSVERIPELSLAASSASGKLISHLKKNNPQDANKLKNLQFKIDNIFSLEEGNLQYDRVIVTAGIKTSDEKRIERLAEKILKPDGRLICPYRDGPMICFNRTLNGITKTFTKDTYAFVPLETL